MLSQTQTRLRPLLWARMWTLGSHSLSQNLINDPSGKTVRRERLSVQEKWLKDDGGLDGLLRADDDGASLLKCRTEAIWCAGYSAGYSRSMVSIMACVVMTVYLYGLFPREWMDVLSPPIMPPGQQRRSGNTLNIQENLRGGTVTLIFVLFAPRCSFLSFKVRPGQQTIQCFNINHTNWANAQNKWKHSLVSELTKMLSFNSGTALSERGKHVKLSN